ncbi:MAG TPA: DUF3943 domain-containing protein [Woeseiaceae bacterium]|nr:DUF3943 domain-containing protein [Woeseiaceae bacterium]
MQRPVAALLALLALSGGGTAGAVDGVPLQDWRLLSADGVTCCLSMPPALIATSTAVDPHTPYLEFPVQTKDAAGLRRDTAYFMGYQFAAVAILYMMPESVTNWSEEDKSDYSMSKWWNNVTSPQMDSDDFYLNWIIHPYWGGSYFVRARERGYSNTESFWYAVLLSTMFEYGAEALAEEPSYQDLVITPVLGSLVGVWFMDVRDGVRERTEARGHRSTGDQWIWVLTDPLGALNRQVDRLFGRDVDAAFAPFVAVPPASADPWARPYAADDEPAVGLNLTLAW